MSGGTKPSDDWISPWRPMIAAIGQDLALRPDSPAPDAIDASSLRRFLEPLEFTCGLHSVAVQARNAGYRDMIAPVSSLMAFVQPPVWDGGSSAWADAAKDALPGFAGQATGFALVPPGAQFFATAFDADYLAPAYLGDRLRRVGRVLISCVPKQTSVGRGVFAVLESRIVDQAQQHIATVRVTMFVFHPYQSKAGAA